MTLKPLFKALKILLVSLLGVIAAALLVVLIMGLTFLIVDRTNGRIVSSGEVRRYLLYVPESYDPARPSPLVISIHGFADWPAHHSRMSGWNALADDEGFIVVYPSGTNFPKRWRTPATSAYPQGSQNDVVFISDLLDSLEQKYNIDPQRIYINGLSNGGGMTFILGCQLSERIAAIGSVAGAYLYPIENCAPARPMPMVAFHGTLDPIVPFNGGPSRSFDVPFPAIPEWIAARAELNQCSSTPLELVANGKVSGIRYTDCSEEAGVDFYTISGGGHTWPGGVPLPEWLTGTTSSDISATQIMWEFFKAHPLPNPGS